MIESISRSISRKIKQSDPEGNVSVEVMEYAIGVKLNLFLTILLTSLLGLMTNELYNSLLALTSFAILRRFSGGLHMKSLTMCAVASSLLFIMIAHIHINNMAIIILTATNTVIFLLFSPNTIEEVNPSKLDPYLKLISTLIVLSSLILMSSTVTLAFVAQGILILPFHKGGEH